MSEENWKAIPGWEGLYEASNLGRVRSKDRLAVTGWGCEFTRRGKVLKPFGAKASRHNMYRYVDLCSNGNDHRKVAIHRLVAWTFLGPQESGIYVRHLNGDVQDNRLSNLAYGTPSENTRNGIRYCRVCARERQRRSRLNKDPHVKPRRLDLIERAEIAKRIVDEGSQCKRGHKFSADNTYVNPQGARQCRTCQSISVAEYQRRKKAKSQ